jgi:hypothetical protein
MLCHTIKFGVGMGYLICRKCKARIDLPHVTSVYQVPLLFKAKCNKCGRYDIYSYADLKDIRFPTREEVEKSKELMQALDPLSPDKVVLYAIINVVEYIKWIKRLTHK